MTATSEQTAEEIVKEIKRLLYVHKNNPYNGCPVDDIDLQYVEKHLNDLFLTNQRLEAEVERMRAEEKRQAYLWFKRGYKPENAFADQLCIECFETLWGDVLRLRSLESRGEQK